MTETNGKRMNCTHNVNSAPCFQHVSFYLQDESSIESDEFDMSDSTRMSAVNSDLSSNLEERMQSPQNLQGQQDGKALILYRKMWHCLVFFPILCFHLEFAFLHSVFH